MSTEPREPPAAAEVHVEARRPEARPRRRPPQWRMIFATGLFAATVYAATEGLLRMAVDASPSPGTASGRQLPRAAQAPQPAEGASRPADPAPGASPAPASPAPEGAGAGAAATNDDADTNEAEPAEGPRRAAPPKASFDEAPEFRESADNNISLPVDI